MLPFVIRRTICTPFFIILALSCLKQVEDYSQTVGDRLIDLVARQRSNSDACCFSMKVHCQFLIHFGLGQRLGPYENGFERQFLLRTAAHYNVREPDSVLSYVSFLYLYDLLPFVGEKCGGFEQQNDFPIYHRSRRGHQEGT